MKKILKFIYSLLLIISFTSCGKWFDINQDPTLLLTPPIGQVMTSATTQVGFYAGSNSFRYTALLSQQFAGQGATGTQTREYMGYLLLPADVNEAFRFHFYAGILPDLDYIIKQTEGKSPHYAGVAKILKAYTYHILVDLWGDVPFTEAGKGSENLLPKYDKGSDVYAALFTMLDEGITNLNATASEASPGSEDVIYAGNRARWRAFAYSLQMRLALRYADKVARMDAILAKTGATFMASNADNFQCVFQSTTEAAGRENPIHQFEIRRQDQFFPSKVLIDMMNTKSDPRRFSYFTPTTGTTFVGAPVDYTAPLFNPAGGITFSRMHTFLRGDSTATASTAGRGRVDVYKGDAPTRLFTYAEYQFIRAEYLFAKGQTANAQTAFQEGIRASMLSANVSSSNITAYIAANGTLSAGTELRQIIEEKYVANYGVLAEPWSDWRRTGFPALVPAANAPTQIIPRILPYSQQERDSNPNTPTRGSIFVKSVFWDN